MLFCSNCKKEVLIYGVSYSPGIDAQLERFRENVEKEEKLILFNPPPIEPYRCPICGELLRNIY